MWIDAFDDPYEAWFIIRKIIAKTNKFPNFLLDKPESGKKAIDFFKDFPFKLKYPTGQNIINCKHKDESNFRPWIFQ